MDHGRNVTNQLRDGSDSHCPAKLANKRFVENAPAEVVTQERERLTEHQNHLANLLQQIAKLEEM